MVRYKEMFFEGGRAFWIRPFRAWLDLGSGILGGVATSTVLCVCVFLKHELHRNACRFDIAKML